MDRVLTVKFANWCRNFKVIDEFFFKATKLHGDANPVILLQECLNVLKVGLNHDPVLVDLLDFPLETNELGEGQANDVYIDQLS